VCLRIWITAHLFLGIPPPFLRAVSPDPVVAFRSGTPQPQENPVTIEMVNGVVTRVSKSRKAPKLAAVPSNTKKTTKVTEPEARTAPASAAAAPVAETPAPVKPTKRGKLALAEDAPKAESETPAPAKSKRNPKSFDAELKSVAKHAQSLAGLADAYAGKMLGDGKTPGTIASYKAELALAMKHLGAETAIAKLTVEKVRAYFESDAVTRLRSGRAKSPLSVDKTRRVLRLALVWAQEQGWVAKAPVPEMPAAS